MASGLAWNTLVSIAVQASRIISSLVLVRILSPADYGLAGMAIVVVSLVATFQDVGFGAGLIQRPTISETDRSTVFWTTVAIGTVSMLVLIALSGFIADFFHEPQVQNLVIVLSFSLFIGSLGMTQGSLLHRAMAYRATSIRLIIATVGACVVAIAVAAAGGGAWALIAYQLAISSLVTILLWQLAAWRPRFVYSRASLKRFAGFGSNILGSRFLEFLQTNMDNILVGRYLGSAALGLYSVSYNVILIPLGRLFCTCRWHPVRGRLAHAGRPPPGCPCVDTCSAWCPGGHPAGRSRAVRHYASVRAGGTRFAVACRDAGNSDPLLRHGDVRSVDPRGQRALGARPVTPRLPLHAAQHTACDRRLCGRSSIGASSAWRPATRS